MRRPGNCAGPASAARRRAHPCQSCSRSNNSRQFDPLSRQTKNCIVREGAECNCVGRSIDGSADSPNHTLPFPHTERQKEPDRGGSANLKSEEWWALRDEEQAEGAAAEAAEEEAEEGQEARSTSAVSA